MQQQFSVSAYTLQFLSASTSKPARLSQIYHIYEQALNNENLFILSNSNPRITILTYLSGCQTGYIRSCQVSLYISDSRYESSSVILSDMFSFLLTKSRNEIIFIVFLGMASRRSLTWPPRQVRLARKVDKYRLVSADLGNKCSNQYEDQLNYTKSVVLVKPRLTDLKSTSFCVVIQLTILS